MAINDFLIRKSDDIFGDRVVLDAPRFKAYANEVHAKRASRTTDEKKKVLDGFNQRLLSGFGGIAELKNVEGDFEILNIHRDNPALDFCEVRPLPLGELPIYRSRILNPLMVTVGNLGAGGGTVYWATTDAGVQVTPFTYQTESVMVPNLNNLYDMQKLEQRAASLQRLDEYKQITRVNIALNTLYGATNVVTADPATSLTTYFSDGGSFSGKSVYFLDPGVPTAAVPSVNIYDLSSTETGLTKKVFQTVRTHSLQIGRNFNKMYIPIAATDGNAPVWEGLQNMATPVALVSGNGNEAPAAAVPHEMWSKFQEANFDGEVIVNWFGAIVSIKKQNWLPAGYIQLFCDNPAIVMWDRLSLQGGNPDDGVLETPVNGYYNKRSATENLAAFRPDAGLRNHLLIKIA